jgi:ribosomal protein S18 acetylase RimI-like enzyme
VLIGLGLSFGTSYALAVNVRALGYRTDLMIRMLEGSSVVAGDGCLVIRTPQNPTFWWGNFLLLAAAPPAGEAARWLAAFAAEFPGAQHVTLGIDTPAAEAVDVSELAAAGLTPDLSAVMTAAALHDPPHPSTDASCRALAGDADWQQAAELRAAVTAGTPGHDPVFLHSRVAAERALTESGHGWWFGAFTGARLCASLGVITDGSGLARYQNVETHPDARRQGLAGTLVVHAGRHALAEGIRQLVMVADPEDIAIRIYRSVGFTRTESQIGFARAPSG